MTMMYPESRGVLVNQLADRNFIETLKEARVNGFVCCISGTGNSPPLAAILSTQHGIESIYLQNGIYRLLDAYYRAPDTFNRATETIRSFQYRIVIASEAQLTVVMSEVIEALDKPMFATTYLDALRQLNLH